jgi:zinc/manganese transport system ATP-binding protein
MNAVEFSGVTLALGGRTVLEDVSLTIGPQEFVAVLGPNGAGKTTFLRAILGLVPPASGHISVLGAAARRGRADVGYLPQTRSGPAARLRGRDMVGAAIRGGRWGLPLLDGEGRRAVDRALDLVGATALADRPLTDMSGGERQRLLLAQALLNEPRMLLLDEPLMSLDPHRQQSVVALVDSLRRELGIAVLFTVHDLNPLLGAIDRVLYLGSGRAAIGTVDEVITGPSLSRLYGSDIEVIRVGGRVFVVVEGMFQDHHHHHHHA